MENQFSSHDFYLCSVLLSLGCKITRLDRQQSNFVEFIFDDPPEKCHELITSYWADELQVNPRKLIESINTLKTRLHSGI